MTTRLLFATALAACLALETASARADKPITYAAYLVDPSGKAVGSATFIAIPGGGVQIHVDTTGLTPGMHGMHIHETGSCNALRDASGTVTQFGAAGPHFDPQNTGHHLGPDGMGHAGDLPAIEADAFGHAATSFYAPRLSVSSGADDIVGRAIVIHAMPDDYTDTPPNGGSGDRVQCGEIGAQRENAAI